MTGQLVSTFRRNAAVAVRRLNLTSSAPGAAVHPAVVRPLYDDGVVRAVVGNAPVEATRHSISRRARTNTPCASPRPFQPGFEAGTTSVQAGGYTPLTMTMTARTRTSRSGNSRSSSPGISAGFEGVKLCGEPQAAEGEWRGKPDREGDGERRAGRRPVLWKPGRRTSPAHTRATRSAS